MQTPFSKNLVEPAELTHGSCVLTPPVIPLPAALHPFAAHLAAEHIPPFRPIPAVDGDQQPIEPGLVLPGPDHPHFRLLRLPPQIPDVFVLSQYEHGFGGEAWVREG